MNEEVKKKVDEEWKNFVAKEKEEANKQKTPYYEADFKIFLSSLSMQAMIAMGKLENPITKTVEKNMEQARYLIDTLAIIKEKTKGNLNKEEESLLNDSLFNLRLIYVEEKNKNDR
ncbi:MAG: DUF1844 domain-containing protein [Candidatus Omnitrophica bacterium]|nr:DUF1844 domain-containing protein [Candidatus Omnitrophota bacterium]